MFPQNLVACGRMPVLTIMQALRLKLSGLPLLATIATDTGRYSSLPVIGEWYSYCPTYVADCQHATTLR